MKKFLKWMKNIGKPKVLVEDIEQILQFERDVWEMQADARFHSMSHHKMWCRIWFNKCEAIHVLLNQNKNNKK
jgi:hypothetical protein